MTAINNCFIRFPWTPAGHMSKTVKLDFSIIFPLVVFFYYFVFLTQRHLIPHLTFRFVENDGNMTIFVAKTVDICLLPRGKLIRLLILKLNNAQKRTTFLIPLKHKNNLSIKLKEACYKTKLLGVTGILGVVSMWPCFQTHSLQTREKITQKTE